MYLTNQSLTQNQLSLIASGKHQVEKLQVWERIAAALDMPDRARILLGLAPLASDEPAEPKGNGPSEDRSPDRAPEHERDSLSSLAVADDSELEALELMRRVEASDVGGTTLALIIHPDWA